ncbi:hypothetical protein ART_1588 [Arthrobacter sp. PAMC 25486]|uniref:hypothetical protein n=1 Tax=Arthrobacter sp. PAMC 25486 TaxID=1494608 RepID=UPI000535CEF7|nr:hypothetical protein [Arthrobacter sp. PAMC 25486]AIY01187.1 hypothetical protein ART_1588 [Arthrobacter sp. PAMC 25486]
MNLPDTVAFLTWLSQHDARIQVTDAEVEIWQYTLSVIPTQNVKDAALEFYRISDDKKPSPNAIRKIAYEIRDRAAAKQSALTAGPTVVNPNGFKQSDPDRWEMLVSQGAEEHRQKLRARGITPHNETCPSHRADPQRSAFSMPN